MNLLFVCSRNQWRSPTAEQLYRNQQGLQVRSAGTSSSARRRISARDIEWADLILVMEREHAQRIRKLFSLELEETPLEILDIPDDYAFMDPELVELAREELPSLQEERDRLVEALKTELVTDKYFKHYERKSRRDGDEEEA